MNDRMSTMPLSLDRPAASRSRARRRRIVAAVLLLAVVCAGAGIGWYRFVRPRASVPVTSPAPQAARAIIVADSLARAPVGARIRVRVVNATESRGLARRATLMLRELGYDVVEFDGDRTMRRDSTLILSHTAHDDWAVRLQRGLGGSAIKASADSSHYVDFTVLLGRDWTPPAQPLRP